MTRAPAATRDVLARMAAKEEEFLGTEFLAPSLPGGLVQVRIAGIVCGLRVEGGAEPGWGIFRPLSLDRARFVRSASLSQVRDYLALFPAVRLVLVAGPEGTPYWIAVKAQRGDARFRVDGAVRVHFVRDAQPFQTVVARFDGTHFWFEGKDRRRSPAIAEYLGESLRLDRPPDSLHKRTLSAEEREAYGIAWNATEAARKGRVQVRLERALVHAGADLRSFIERQDAYTVRYTVDGSEHTSTVRKDDLTVLVAGICLSGEDERFDLTSLVGVLREGGEDAVRVGPGGMPEEAYRRVHPREGR